ncbi:hypothetical protein D3C86_1681720 [compost metagenome]
MTMISPSSARMVLLSARLLVIKSEESTPETDGAMSETSCSTSRRNVEPSLMYGLIFRLMPTSLRSTVVNGLSAPLLLVA